MSKKQKKMLARIIISFILFLAVVFIPINNKYLQLVAALIPFIIIGYDILLKSARNILHGQIFDENFLMSIATIGSFVLGYCNGTGDYDEGTAVLSDRRIFSELCCRQFQKIHCRIDGYTS